MNRYKALSETQAWTELHGLELEPGAWRRLDKYQQILALFASSTNLVASADPRAFFMGHVADCVFVRKALADDLALMDVGSGAGFPGLVLACAEPDRPIILQEPRMRRVAFLKEVVRQLELKNVSVIQGRFPDMPAHVPSPRALVSRATFEPGRWLALGLAKADPRDAVLAMITPNQERALASLLGEYALAGCSLERWGYRIPDGRTRVLLRLSRGPSGSR